MSLTRLSAIEETKSSSVDLPWHQIGLQFLGIQFNLLDSEKNQKFFVEKDDIDIDKRLQFLFWFEITN